MKTPSIERGQAEGLPLTHAAYLAATKNCGNPPRVQVRKHFPDGPCTFCGKVKELTVGRIEWFQVETMLGDSYFDGRNTRLCSGDGRCTCEAGHATEALLEVAIPTEIAISRLMRDIGGEGHE